MFSMLGSDEIALDARSGRPIAPESVITTSLWTGFLIFFAAASGYVGYELWQIDRAGLGMLSAASVAISLLAAINRLRQARRLRRTYQLKLSNYKAGLEQPPL